MKPELFLPSTVLKSAPNSATFLAFLATLVLGGPACETEVVDFALKGASRDAALGDLYPGSCTVEEALAHRCTTCKHPVSGAITKSCEDLLCKYKPLDESGTFCKYCFWSDHPKPECKMCWDAQQNLLVDTCHTSNGG